MPALSPDTDTISAFRHSRRFKACVRRAVEALHALVGDDDAAARARRPHATPRSIFSHGLRLFSSSHIGRVLSIITIRQFYRFDLHNRYAISLIIMRAYSRLASISHIDDCHNTLRCLFILTSD